MKFEVLIAGQSQQVELGRRQQAWECVVNGRPRRLDLIEVAPGILSMLLEGESFEVHVEAFDRTGGGVHRGYRVHTRGADWMVEVTAPGRSLGGGSRLGRGGQQRITAPMPGKVIRVLVVEKQPVEEGQGVVVVEAMKMQNEISAPKSGVVERLLVREGDTVNHGDLLAVVN